MLFIRFLALHKHQKLFKFTHVESDIALYRDVLERFGMSHFAFQTERLVTELEAEAAVSRAFRVARVVVETIKQLEIVSLAAFCEQFLHEFRKDAISVNIA